MFNLSSVIYSLQVHRVDNLKPTNLNNTLTFPEPEQLGHLSVLGGDRGLSAPLIVETGSIRTRAPVLEHRAQARYPAYTFSNHHKIHLHSNCSPVGMLFLQNICPIQEKNKRKIPSRIQRFKQRKPPK